MKFTKILPYKLRRALPMLGLAGATMVMNGCSKDDEPVMQDVVYNWGATYVSEIWPTDNLIKSAERRDVRHVILQYNGETWGYTVNEKNIIDDFLEPVMRAIPAQYHDKFVGRGTMPDVVLRYPEARKILEERWNYKIIGHTPSELYSNQR